MKFHVMTLFPDIINNVMKESIMGRAVKSGYISIDAVNIRDFAGNKHNSVDDYPYGGGAGMVMQAEPIYNCYKYICERIRAQGSNEDAVEGTEQFKMPRLIYVTPQGKTFNQKLAREYSKEEELIFLCGRYEGIDERVLELIVTDYVSVGDYVLTGGELPALVMIDAISRLVPGVLGNGASAGKESFSGSLLEYPQYTRPENWHGKEVPPVLTSGNHKLIAQWCRRQSVIRTADRRPDLIKGADLTEEEQQLVKKILMKGSDVNEIY